MRLLLDTHVALWAITADPRLPDAVRILIEDPANDVSVSVVSVWEIAIKHALRRGRATDMPISGTAALGYFRTAGYRLLHLSAEHAVAIEALPMLHSDPFDRMIVAQAFHEPLKLITRDASVQAYGSSIMLI